jgi:hypothetical protein
VKRHSPLNISHKLGSNLLPVKFMLNFVARFPSRTVNICKKYYYDLVREHLDGNPNMTRTEVTRTGSKCEDADTC